MKIEYKNIVLRDMTESDIDDEIVETMKDDFEVVDVSDDDEEDDD